MPESLTKRFLRVLILFVVTHSYCFCQSSKEEYKDYRPNLACVLFGHGTYKCKRCDAGLSRPIYKCELKYDGHKLLANKFLPTPIFVKLNRAVERQPTTRYLSNTPTYGVPLPNKALFNTEFSEIGLQLLNDLETRPFFQEHNITVRLDIREETSPYITYKKYSSSNRPTTNDESSKSYSNCFEKRGPEVSDTEEKENILGSINFDAANLTNVSTRTSYVGRRLLQIQNESIQGIPVESDNAIQSGRKVRVDRIKKWRKKVKIPNYAGEDSDSQEQYEQQHLKKLQRKRRCKEKQPDGELSGSDTKEGEMAITERAGIILLPETLPSSKPRAIVSYGVDDLSVEEGKLTDMSIKKTDLEQSSIERERLNGKLTKEDVHPSVLSSTKKRKRDELFVELRADFEPPSPFLNKSEDTVNKSPASLTEATSEILHKIVTPLIDAKQTVTLEEPSLLANPRVKKYRKKSQIVRFPKKELMSDLGMDKPKKSGSKVVRIKKYRRKTKPKRRIKKRKNKLLEKGFASNHENDDLANKAPQACNLSSQAAVDRRKLDTGICNSPTAKAYIDNLLIPTSELSRNKDGSLSDKRETMKSETFSNLSSSEDQKEILLQPTTDELQSSITSCNTPTLRRRKNEKISIPEAITDGATILESCRQGTSEAIGGNNARASGRPIMLKVKKISKIPHQLTTKDISTDNPKKGGGMLDRIINETETYKATSLENRADITNVDGEQVHLEYTNHQQKNKLLQFATNDYNTPTRRRKQNSGNINIEKLGVLPPGSSGPPQPFRSAIKTIPLSNKEETVTDTTKSKPISVDKPLNMTMTTIYEYPLEKEMNSNFTNFPKEIHQIKFNNIPFLKQPKIKAYNNKTSKVLNIIHDNQAVKEPLKVVPEETSVTPRTNRQPADVSYKVNSGALVHQPSSFQTDNIVLNCSSQVDLPIGKGIKNSTNKTYNLVNDDNVFSLDSFFNLSRSNGVYDNKQNLFKCMENNSGTVNDDFTPSLNIPQTYLGKVSPSKKNIQANEPSSSGSNKYLPPILHALILNVEDLPTFESVSLEVHKSHQSSSGASILENDLENECTGAPVSVNRQQSCQKSIRSDQYRPKSVISSDNQQLLSDKPHDINSDESSDELFKLCDSLSTIIDSSPPSKQTAQDNPKAHLTLSTQPASNLSTPLMTLKKLESRPVKKILSEKNSFIRPTLEHKTTNSSMMVLPSPDIPSQSLTCTDNFTPGPQENSTRNNLHAGALPIDKQSGHSGLQNNNTTGTLKVKGLLVPIGLTTNTTIETNNNLEEWTTQVPAHNNSTVFQTAYEIGQSSPKVDANKPTNNFTSVGITEDEKLEKSFDTYNKQSPVTSCSLRTSDACELPSITTPQNDRIETEKNKENNSPPVSKNYENESREDDFKFFVLKPFLSRLKMPIMATEIRTTGTSRPNYEMLIKNSKVQDETIPSDGNQSIIPKQCETCQGVLKTNDFSLSSTSSNPSIEELDTSIHEPALIINGVNSEDSDTNIMGASINTLVGQNSEFKSGPVFHAQTVNLEGSSENDLNFYFNLRPYFSEIDVLEPQPS